MSSGSISPISSSMAGNVNFNQNTFSDNGQISSMLTNGNIDPRFAQMLIAQMTANNVNNILFGSEDTNGTAGSGDLDVFGTQATGSQNNFDAFGVSNGYTGVSSQFEMSVYSSLIGKTVTATDPSSGKQVTGKVTSVQTQNGNVAINVGGTIVTPENLLKIQ